MFEHGAEEPGCPVDHFKTSQGEKVLLGIMGYIGLRPSTMFSLLNNVV